MYKTKTRNHNQFKIGDDLAKIRAILSDTATHLGGSVTGAVSQSVENAKDKSFELKGNVEDYVAERPLKSIGLAMLSGIFLGYLMHGKRNSHRR